jgi:SNF family Na+-dependent transporter
MRPRHAQRLPALEGFRMLDVVMVAMGLAFFALSVGYTVACDRL